MPELKNDNPVYNITHMKNVLNWGLIYATSKAFTVEQKKYAKEYMKQLAQLGIQQEPKEQCFREILQKIQ